jgi:peptide/nickel transport system permease protein
MTTRGSKISLLFLAGIHLVVLFAGFIAPYDYAAQNRSLPYASPSKIHFLDANGKFHLQPFVYQRIEDPTQYRAYQELTDTAYPVHFFVHGVAYQLAGILNTDRHLFGAQSPGVISILGTDGYGRDLFSRFVYGARISLCAGLLATVLSLLGGTSLGMLSGFYGGWIDGVIMRLADLFLSLPWLYLLFAVRAFLPLHISPAEAFFLVIAVIGTVGWARPARLVRGVVLSAREHKFVLACKTFGASDFYLLRRHLFPQTQGIVLTQAALLIPQYILAEVTLSFFGLGIGEPVPSWGSMLASLQQYHVLASCWWMLFPGLALIPISLSYCRLSQALQERGLQ